MKNKTGPQPVKKVLCPKCNELQLKIYPWSNLGIPEGLVIPPCKKCLLKK